MKTRARLASVLGMRLSGRLIAWVVLLSICTAFSYAEAHVIMGKKSLHLSVAESTWVVRGRVTDPHKLFVSTDGSKRRELVELQVLEIIKGPSRADATDGLDAIRVAQDGHEAPTYSVGDEAIFFLGPIEASRELRSLAVAGGATHVSSQEHDEAFRIKPPNGQILLTAIRSFARSETLADPKARVALIREATLDLITSGDPQLSSAALASLVLAPHASLVTAPDLPRLLELLAGPKASIGLKAGLIAELERRGFIDGPQYWHGLLEGASAAELPAAIRAAGTHSSESVRVALLKLLTSPETAPAIAAEAAIALGASPGEEVIRALSAALGSASPRLRNAVIRGLGQMSNEGSQRALYQAAETHVDPATRRRARAEWSVVSARLEKRGASLRLDEGDAARR